MITIFDLLYLLYNPGHDLSTPRGIFCEDFLTGMKRRMLMQHRVGEGLAPPGQAAAQQWQERQTGRIPHLRMIPEMIRADIKSTKM